MNARDPIEGKVARILNARELVINRGSDHGVARGMVFEVLDPTGSEISDPDTKELLGSVLRPKVRVKVTIVQEKLAVASTFRIRRKNVGGAGGMDITRILGQPPRWIEVPETFKAEEALWENITEAQSYVKRGDPVREVVPSQEVVATTADVLEPAE